MQAKLGHHPSTGAEERSGIEGIEMSIVSSGLGMDGKEKPSNKSASKDVLTPSMGPLSEHQTEAEAWVGGLWPRAAQVAQKPPAQ